MSDGCYVEELRESMKAGELRLLQIVGEKIGDYTHHQDCIHSKPVLHNASTLHSSTAFFFGQSGPTQLNSTPSASEARAPARHGVSVCYRLAKHEQQQAVEVCTRTHRIHIYPPAPFDPYFLRPVISEIRHQQLEVSVRSFGGPLCPNPVSKHCGFASITTQKRVFTHTGEGENLR